MQFKVLCLILCFLPFAAKAHPHVFVDARFELVFVDNKLHSINQEWHFDELFSMSIIDDFDANQDGVFSEEEIANVQENAFENLKNYNFFNNIFYGENKIENLEYTSFKAAIDDKKMIYDFTVALKEPLDVLTSLTSIGLYDPEYFIDIVYIKDNPVSFKDNSIKCDYVIKEDIRNPIFSGYIAPKTVFLECE